MTKEDRAKTLYAIWGGGCPICKKSLVLGQFEVHHGGVHDTKGSNKVYKKFTQSLMNLYPLHHHCHKENQSFGRVSVEIADACEKFLELYDFIVKSGQVQKQAIIKELSK